MKFRGFEFEDQPWFPEIIRDYMTDYLRFLFRTFKLYQPVIPLLEETLLITKNTEILDLCSGSGGTMELIYNSLKLTFSNGIKITLSDLYPSLLVYRRLYEQTGGGISYVELPVDAISVPSEIKGFRTLFSGFHHFEPFKAKAILENTIVGKSQIGIFDGGNKSIWMIVAIVIMHPLLLFFCTPFIKPLRISRLLFTYLIPVIPFCAVWDGIISIIRLYSPQEMLKMAREADTDHQYTWISGKKKNIYGLSITYLIGYPLIEKP